MPIKKDKYPPNWKAIALSIKEEANWTCENCDRPCKKPSETWDEFKYRLARKRKSMYLDCCQKPIRFILTVSHQDHDTTNNAPANLKSLCSGCHLRYDAKYHAANAKKTRAKTLAKKRSLSES